MSHDTKNIRNVVLLGHSGSGKTTFSECMLFEAGETHRRGTIASGNTVSDYLDIEQEKGNSILSSLLHVGWKDSKINILDTPGLDDFIGEVISSLKVAAIGVIMLNAKNGVEVGTELIWDYVQDFHAPALFVVNQLDHEQADFEATLEQAQERFGPKVIPIQFPVQVGGGFNAIVDALRMQLYVFPEEGGKPQKQAIPPSLIGRAQEMHNALVEAAAENDEALMEKFFDEGSLNEEELAEGLKIAIAQQELFPLFCCSAERNMGSGRIMGFINDICPSPAERKAVRLSDGTGLNCTTEEATTIFIFKTISEPRVGLVSYFKVYSGTLKAGDELVNAANGSVERFSQLYLANGKDRISIDVLKAGDIGVCLKLKNAHSNNTLNSKGTDRMVEPMHFPTSSIRVAIAPLAKGQMEKLMKALHIMEEEDPTLHVEQSATLKQTLLHGQGQLHIDMVKHRMELVHGIEIEFVRPRIAYRETITTAADAHYRHKKQSGGSGQFGEVHLRIESYDQDMPDPEGLHVRQREIEELPWGGKLAFYWCIVGGTIDNKYMNAIKKGILQKMEEGPLTGSACQDIRVSIYDGKMHSVDSNDMAFMLATGHAFKEAFEQAKPKLLEPIYDLEVLCSSEVMGDVLSDLQTRRAMIMGMDTLGHYQKIMAHVPQVEMYMYSSTLRSLTQGRAKFTRKFLEYSPVLPEIQAELVAHYRSEDVEA
jgi:elongation factor G